MVAQLVLERNMRKRPAGNYHVSACGKITYVWLVQYFKILSTHDKCISYFLYLGLYF